MAHETKQPTRNERGLERHPAFGLIGASRVQSTPGAVLFDSDIRHSNTVIVRLHLAVRDRDLNHDWLGTDGRTPIVEVEMSEAQWASFVSTMNVGDGVPCTIRHNGGEDVPGLPFEPRMAESMAEVRDAAARQAEKVSEAFAAYEAKKNAENLRTLKYAIQNMPANVEWTAKSLTEHAENVVQRARADIEAMVVSKARQLGLEPGDMVEALALEAGEPENALAADADGFDEKIVPCDELGP